MAFSTLFDLDSKSLTSEAEVETRFLSKVFYDLGYPDESIIPKKSIKPLRINDGVKSSMKEVDFMLKDKNNIPRVIVEAKDPSINIIDAWGQAASYALSFNRDKKATDKIKWLLITNGHVTGLFPHDSIVPLITLQLSDFASGIPPYVALRNYIKYDSITEERKTALPFLPLPPQDLNQKFTESHNLVWKKEKMAPADAFFEFCKFIFIKIQEDKKRQTYSSDTATYEIPLTLEWLKAQEKTSNHPVRDILFKKLHEELEVAISEKRKKRIFEKDETLRLSAATCKELIEKFQSIDLSSIDEDLNGRMFEVFLAASIRGKDLGQFFTPRSVVDFMTRISLRNTDINNPPLTLDACCGTSGFLIEVMAYLTGRLRGDNRLTQKERTKIKDYICNDCLFGVEANERVARIARINMYLHGDGGSHIFHGDGLDESSQEKDDMTPEQKESVREYRTKITDNMFDIVLSNPPFSMKYDRLKVDEKRIINQFDFTNGFSSVKSSILFLNRYFKLLKPNGEMLIVLDDTILNGKSFENIRKWILDKFIILGVHSLPFNAFFKAKANIKTSILHLRKKENIGDEQGYVFMSISNNIGHDNSLKDTPYRNSLNEILIAYLEWQRTGVINPILRENSDASENLECPMQYWLVAPEQITTERIDAFFYCPDLRNSYLYADDLLARNNIDILEAKDLLISSKITPEQKQELIDSQQTYKYIEIGDVTKYGLITRYIEDTFENLPSRGEYLISKGDILLALNNSSRGTVVIVPDEFDNAICTSGFLVIKPKNEDEGLLLWYTLRSEFCKKQIYYLAQTASQPELKIESWNKYFKIPIPTGKERNKAIQKAREYYDYLKRLTDIDRYHFSF